jgi:hypothetical protein
MPLKVNGVQIKVTSVSPLAEAPKMEEVNQLLSFMQIANSMGPMGQAIINVPESISNTPEEQQMMMQQMQQAMIEQQQPMPTDETVAEAMQ